MIIKSFELENNINIITKFHLILIYGENIGLKDSLKKRIIKQNSKSEIVNLYQEDFIKNKRVLINEIENISLFVEQKLIFINQANERSLDDIKDFEIKDQNLKIVFLADTLDKRSKLRSYFEKDKEAVIIPCYNDTDITLRKLIQSELKDFKNLNSNMINMIITYSNLNRTNVISNLLKIKTYFENKIISDEKLDSLLNTDKNELFENIIDATLEGNKTKLNNLLGKFLFANEDSHMYLNMINYRLLKLLEIHKTKANNKESFDVTINKVKPPIFWKDKPTYLKLLKTWDKSKVLGAVSYLSTIDSSIKKNSNLDKLTIVKNSITNICSNSWTYF